MSGFNSSITGDFDKYFMTTTELIDRYAQGGLWGCGYNSKGSLGDGTITYRSSPVQTIAGGTNWKQISHTGYHHTAIKTDGTLWVWGYNAYGQLGDNTIVPKSSPVQTIAGGTNWKYVSGGQFHTAAIKTDGTLWTWGYDFNGQLGDNTQVAKSSPIQTIAGGTSWKQVSGGTTYTAAIKTDGTLWLWGSNVNGGLGDNTIIDKSSPVQTIAGGTNWKQVSASPNGWQTAAIKTDGTLWTWGYDFNGQLGDNTQVNKSSPVQTIAGGTNWKQVSMAHRHFAALKTDGTLWTCGYNVQGGLGDNTNTQKLSPVQTITGGSNWKQVSCGQHCTTAIKTDGTLWLWGWNGSTQLGDNTFTNRSSPIQTIAGGTNWKQVSAGGNYTSAIQYSDIGQVL